MLFRNVLFCINNCIYYRITCFNIKNKCTKLIEIEEIKTSKRDPEFHGIGLRSVRRTEKKYDGQMAMYIKNEEFNTNILIQNKID